MTAYVVASGGKLHAFFSWKIDRGVWLPSRLSNFTHHPTPRKDTGTQYIGDYVKCLASLEVLEKIKNPCPYWGWTHYSFIRQSCFKINMTAILNDFYQDL